MTGTSTVRPPRTAKGFTLLELMLVVVIIGLLATVAVVNLTGSGETARRGATVGTLSQVKQAVQQYHMKHGSYPATLVQLATGTNPLLERVPQDAWRRDLLYMTPGIDAGRPYSLYSLGSDGQPSTADDINVWTMDQPE
jgi:general secretion pathway protein G